MNLQTLNETSGLDVSDQSDPDVLIDWMLRRFADRRMCLTSAFGMEGCALIDMIAARAERFTVIYLDTHFFFSQTHELIDKLKERYAHLEFVNKGTDLTPQEQAKRCGDELWKRDPDMCCQMRKVQPMIEAVRSYDVWVTGLRRSQSPHRANMQVVEWEWKYDLLKVNPLARWERKDVWEYIQKHQVPYNVLHEQGYPSVGCTHCTKPVPGSKVTDYSRSGRWEGQTKTECGLHGDGI